MRRKKKKNPYHNCLISLRLFYVNLALTGIGLFQPKNFVPHWISWRLCRRFAPILNIFCKQFTMGSHHWNRTCVKDHKNSEKCEENRENLLWFRSLVSVPMSLQCKLGEISDSTFLNSTINIRAIAITALKLPG